MLSVLDACEAIDALVGMNAGSVVMRQVLGSTSYAVLEVPTSMPLSFHSRDSDVELRVLMIDYHLYQARAQSMQARFLLL